MYIHKIVNFFFFFFIYPFGWLFVCVHVCMPYQFWNVGHKFILMLFICIAYCLGNIWIAFCVVFNASWTFLMCSCLPSPFPTVIGVMQKTETFTGLDAHRQSHCCVNRLQPKPCSSGYFKAYSRLNDDSSLFILLED